MDELQYQIDLLNEMNQQLSSEVNMLRMICSTSGNAFLYYNFEEDRIQTQGNFNTFFNINLSQTGDLEKLYELVEESFIPALRDLFFIENKELACDSLIFRLKDEKSWVECEMNIYCSEEGVPIEKVMRFKNITRFKAQKEELLYMAYYDTLTGLYNRNYFVRLLGDFVHRAEAEQTVLAVMFIDIDDFRRINDGLGIIVGDEIVQLFGQFLGTLKSDNILVSHFSSDIYCLGIYEPCGNRSTEHIYQKIQKRLHSPFILSNGKEVSISVSIGVAEYPEAANTTLELINCAEIVMFKSKSIGKNSMHYFDAPILQDFLYHIAIENKLKEAVINENFMMYFQPQYHSKDKKIRGVEALIRWRDKEGNMISPSVFIPIAEKNGTIVPIGTWVIEESVRIYAKWKKTYNPSLILSLNISAIQYKCRDFVNKLMQTLEKYEVQPSQVELEITESVLIDDFGEMINKLITLRNFGIKISLDDFGTGYSSLSYLKGLPIDTLKIDKSFIDTVISDNNTRIIMESIVFMVKKLGYETVAEGVETKEQFEYLKSIECDNIQGYFLGKPMPPEEVERILMES